MTAGRYWSLRSQSLSFCAISEGSFPDLPQARENIVKGVSDTYHCGGAKRGGCRHPLTAALALDDVEPVDCAAWMGRRRYPLTDGSELSRSVSMSRSPRSTRQAPYQSS